jgi:hypothetical protein
VKASHGTIMNYLIAYLRNLLVITLVIGVMFIFVRIFYPGVLTIYSEMGNAYTILKLWPILILGLLVMALPQRRRR